MKSVKEDSIVINNNSMISRNIDIDDADLDGEKVMMNIDKGRYFSMNPVGSRIWEMIDKPNTIEEIITMLLKEYNVDYDKCRIEVIKFIKKLYNSELVKIN